MIKRIANSLPITIRPSPDPISNNFLFLFAFLLNKFNIFSTWVVVAGTYGRQYFRKAGATNGIQITLNATPMPPIKKIIYVLRYLIVYIMKYFLPVRPIRTFPPNDKLNFDFLTFLFDEKLFNCSSIDDMIFVCYDFEV